MKVHDIGHAWVETAVLADFGGDTVIVGRSPDKTRRVLRRNLRTPLRLAAQDTAALVEKLVKERDQLEAELWEWRDWAAVVAGDSVDAFDDESLRAAVYNIDEDEDDMDNDDSSESFKRSEAADGVKAPRSDRVYRSDGPIKKPKSGLTHNPFADLLDGGRSEQ